MGLFQTGKPKSAAKLMIPSGEKLESKVLSTLSHIAQMVGATLGPGGKQVLIERPEIGMKPIITKDGVTVIKHLGYEEAAEQLILEAVRDAAIRTANEAGDGTTTATILSNAIAQHAAEVVRKNPKISPQKIVREMQALVPYIENKVKSYRINIDGDNYDSVLLKVAELSANGDKDLSASIMKGLDSVGEEGDMTIIESIGESRYLVERINGYTVERGYEESARNFANQFINDNSGTMVVMNNPVFILYDGIVNDFGQILEGAQKIAEFLRTKTQEIQYVVFVANGFSDSVLGDLSLNWNHERTKVKIYPMLTPEKAIQNWRTNFLYDLQAYTGTPVFNPLSRPFSDVDPESLLSSNRATRVEVSRYKSMIFATEDEAAIGIRVDELKLQKQNPESDYELNDLNVRIGKLTSGIVRLTISGPSAGETREKRDRADDAWMAIRGAIKHGAVPGGGYVLVRLASDLLAVSANMTVSPTKRLAAQILSESLIVPTTVLYKNYGYNDEDISLQLIEILKREDETFDISEQQWVDKHGLLDSVPAVLEAIRNSISIASLLGTIGGIVAFKRDRDSDKEEERLVRQFESAIGERGSLNQNG
jgi:chaperonin GroEL